MARRACSQRPQRASSNAHARTGCNVTPVRVVHAASIALAIWGCVACRRQEPRLESSTDAKAAESVSSAVVVETPTVSPSAAPRPPEPPIWCTQAEPWLSLADRARRRLDRASRAVKAQGVKSLAAPALASAAGKCVEAAGDAVQRLRAIETEPQDAAAKQAALVSLDAVISASRPLQDGVQRAVQGSDAAALATALAQFDSSLPSVEATLRQQTKVIDQRCPRRTRVSVSDARPAVPSSASATRERAADSALMVLVDKGPFVRGAESEDAEIDEFPSKVVDLPSFWIDRAEVTVDQYRRCVDGKVCSRPSRGPSCNEGQALRQHPINCVSWEQARAYCQWGGARLPSEAEWEKASRGTDGRTFPWGEELPSCDRVTWFDPQRGHGCGTHSTAVAGSKPLGASPYGALDMAGNVWEWVEDVYHPRWDAGEATGETSALRVLRGGGWGKDGWGSLRTTARLRLARQISTPGTGFRCAMSETASDSGGAP